MNDVPTISGLLNNKFGSAAVMAEQPTADGIPTLWIAQDHLKNILSFLKHEVEKPYRMLYDLCGIDERKKTKRNGQPASDFTVVYHLTSFARNEDIRIKVGLSGEYPEIPSITGIWPNANWYEKGGV